jgi:MFS superfamily sulfate permease-like transporter
MPISIAALFGLFLCVVPGLILFIRYALVAPVVMMEGLRGRAALRRSTQLVKRSLPTVIAVISINLLVPLILGIFMAVVVALTSQGSEPKKTKTENSQAIQENAEGQQTPAAKEEIQNSDNAVDGKQNDGIRITTSMGGPVLKIEEGSGSVEERRRKRINNTVREEIIQLLWLPVAFFIASLFSVVQALLYLKTRQAGGESMQNLLAQFEETDQPQRNWQTRLKDRLEQSGRTASKS